MAASAFVLSGIAYAGWHRLLVATTGTGTSTADVAKKTLLDYCIFGASCNVG